jgi:hypothetical protein
MCSLANGVGTNQLREKAQGSSFDKLRTGGRREEKNRLKVGVTPWRGSGSPTNRLVVRRHRHSNRDTNPLIVSFTTAFLILLAAAAGAGLITSNFLFGYLWFLRIQ